MITIKSIIQNFIDTDNPGMPDYQKREIFEAKMKLLREEIERYKQEYGSGWRKNSKKTFFVDGFNKAIEKIIKEELTY